MSKVSGVSGAIRRFHNDEQGMEVLQAVLLVAVAALIGVVLKQVGSHLLNLAKDQASSTMTDAL